MEAYCEYRWITSNNSNLIMPRHITSSGFNVLFFSGGSESYSTSTMNQTNFYLGGTLSLSGGGPTANSAHSLQIYPSAINYPHGSGSANKWGDSFTLYWDWDVNEGSSPTGNVEHWFIHGRNVGSTMATHPESSTDKFIGICRYYSGGSEYVYAIINDGTSIDYSDIVELGTYSTNKKSKFCCTWDGTTLSVYAVYASANYYDNAENQWQLSFICSAEYTGALTSTSSMSHYRTYFMDYFLANVGTSNVYIGNLKFNRSVAPPI